MCYIILQQIVWALSTLNGRTVVFHAQRKCRERRICRRHGTICVLESCLFFFFSRADISCAHRLLCACSQWQRFFGKSHILKLAHDLGEMHCASHRMCGWPFLSQHWNTNRTEQLHPTSWPNCVLPAADRGQVTADRHFRFRHAKFCRGSHESVVRATHRIALFLSRLCRTTGDAMRI